MCETKSEENWANPTKWIYWLVPSINMRAMGLPWAINLMFETESAEKWANPIQKGTLVFFYVSQRAMGQPWEINPGLKQSQQRTGPTQ
jgi:hypothetical protein